MKYIIILILALTFQACGEGEEVNPLLGNWTCSYWVDCTFNADGTVIQYIAETAGNTPYLLGFGGTYTLKDDLLSMTFDKVSCDTYPDIWLVHNIVPPIKEEPIKILQAYPEVLMVQDHNNVKGTWTKGFALDHRRLLGCKTQGQLKAHPIQVPKFTTNPPIQ
jgi:hypothetical protein